MRDSPRPSCAAMLAGLPLAVLAGLYVYAGRTTAQAPAHATHAATPTQCGEGTDLRTAWFIAQEHVRQRIGSRHEASFEGLEAGTEDPADRVRITGRGRYLVEGWVQPDPGAVRQRFRCELTRNGGGSWICDRLEIVQAY